MLPTPQSENLQVAVRSLELHLLVLTAVTDRDIDYAFSSFGNGRPTRSWFRPNRS